MVLIPIKVTIKAYYTLNNCASQESKCRTLKNVSVYISLRGTETSIFLTSGLNDNTHISKNV